MNSNASQELKTLQKNTIRVKTPLKTPTPCNQENAHNGLI